MNIEQLREREAALKGEINALKSELEAVEAMIAAEIAPYKVGDIVSEEGGVKYKISSVTVNGNWIRYYGHKILKHGSTGAKEFPIFGIIEKCQSA